MGLDDDDASGESEDEWQRLLAGAQSRPDTAAPEAPSDGDRAADTLKPRTGSLLAAFSSPATQNGAAKARALDSPAAAAKQPQADAKQGRSSLPEGAGRARVSSAVSQLEEEWRKLLEVQWDKVESFEEDAPVEDEEDAVVVPLRWLDEGEKQPPPGRKLAPAAKAPVKPRQRPTAVKSMPFRPPDFLPTDIVLRPPAKPSAGAVPSPEKRPALGAPDLGRAGPPPKAARVEISRPGDLLRHMTGALKKPPAPGEKPHSNGKPPAEEAKKVGALNASDKDGRPYDLTRVVVNFAGVGAAFVRAARGRDPKKNYAVFDWDGVRLCVRHLRLRLGLKVVGVTSENLVGPDRGSARRLGLPSDIKLMCESIEVADGLLEPHPRRAARIATLSAAWRKNCRFMSDDVGDRVQVFCDSECRGWLRAARRTLLMRFFFGPQQGHFETPDGGAQARA